MTLSSQIYLPMVYFREDIESVPQGQRVQRLLSTVKYLKIVWKLETKYLFKKSKKLPNYLKIEFNSNQKMYNSIKLLCWDDIYVNSVDIRCRSVWRSDLVQVG